MSMRARAEAQGGELSVASRPEGGATVRAWLP
jgi:signal transduction histidine kinase